MEPGAPAPCPPLRYVICRRALRAHGAGPEFEDEADVGVYGCLVVFSARGTPNAGARLKTLRVHLLEGVDHEGEGAYGVGDGGGVDLGARAGGALRLHGSRLRRRLELHRSHAAAGLVRPGGCACSHDEEYRLSDEHAFGRRRAGVRRNPYSVLFGGMAV